MNLNEPYLIAKILDYLDFPEVMIYSMVAKNVIPENYSWHKLYKINHIDFQVYRISKLLVPNLLKYSLNIIARYIEIHESSRPEINNLMGNLLLRCQTNEIEFLLNLKVLNINKIMIIDQYGNKVKPLSYTIDRGYGAITRLIINYQSQYPELNT